MLSLQQRQQWFHVFMRPDSVPRLWRYINLLFTYLHRWRNLIEFNSWQDSVKPSEKSKLKTSSRLTLIISGKNCIVCQLQLLTGPWCLRNKVPLLRSIRPHTKSSNFHPKCEQQRERRLSVWSGQLSTLSILSSDSMDSEAGDHVAARQSTNHR